MGLDYEKWRGLGYTREGGFFMGGGGFFAIAWEGLKLDSGNCRLAKRDAGYPGNHIIIK